MQCPRCNSKLDASLRFCPSCGLSVEELVQSLAMEQPEPGDQEKVTEDEPDLESGVPSSDELAGTEGDQAATSVGEDTDPADAGDSSEERIEDDQAGPADNPASSESESDDTADEPVAQDGIAALEESDGALAADPETVPAAQRSNEPDAGEKEALPGEEQESGSGLARFVKKHAVVLTALLVMLVGCVVALGIWIYRNNEAAAHKQEQEQAYQKALGTAQVVPLVIQIDGYDEGASSPIPLKVTGTSKVGDAVDKVVLVKPSMPQLELLPGTYSIALAGYPVTADGTLFRGSVDTYEVTVGDSSSSDHGKSSGSAQDVVSVTPVFAFAQIAPQEVRDSDVDALRAWLEAAQIQNAPQYVDAVTARRQEALDQIEQEQAQKEEQDLRELEETTKQLEKEVADRNKSQNGTNGQMGNNSSERPSNSTYSNGGQGAYGSYDEYDSGYYDDYYYYY